MGFFYQLEDSQLSALTDHCMCLCIETRRTDTPKLPPHFQTSLRALKRMTPMLSVPLQTHLEGRALPGQKQDIPHQHYATFPLWRLTCAAPLDDNANHQSPSRLAPGPQQWAAAHEQREPTQPPGPVLPPLPSTSSPIPSPAPAPSGLRFPIATLSLEVLSHLLQLPAPNPPPAQSCLHQGMGRTVARNLFMTSKYSLQPSPFVFIWSQGRSEAPSEVTWMKTQLKLNWGRGRFLASLITA